MATDEELRQVVIEACDWLEHQSFTANMVGDAQYGDNERHYLIGWRDGYSRACMMLRSAVSKVEIPDGITVIDGEIREITSS